MKVCFTWLTIIGLAVWSVGCGPANTGTGGTGAAPADTSTELGPPGGMESGSGTAGMSSDTSTEDTSSENAAPEDSSASDTSTEEGSSDGPALPDAPNQ